MWGQRYTREWQWACGWDQVMGAMQENAKSRNDWVNEENESTKYQEKRDWVIIIQGLIH